MSELIPILEAVVGDVDAGRPVALCAVVKTTGSTPRTPGAAMVVRSDGTTIGTVGGGLVETQVRDMAGEMLRQNQAARLESALDHDCDSSEGMICGGWMQFVVMPVMPTTPLEPFRQALDRARRREPAWLPLTVVHEGKTLEYRLHLEVPPTLLVAGAGHVGQAVARLAAGLDFHVVVFDDRADLLSKERFDDGIELVAGDIGQVLGNYPLDAACYVVIVTRGHQHDQRALEAVIRRTTAYVGMMGSRRKSAAVLEALTRSGIPRELLDRVHTPIGLSIGAVTVPELAVSILAELIQVRNS